MIEKIDPSEILHKLSKHKKFMWISHLRNSGALVIRPTWDPHPTGIESEILLIQEQFPDLIIFESYIDESYDKLREFGLSHDELRNMGSLKPMMVTFKNGWVDRNSHGMCYCTETLVDLIISLHPEFLSSLT